MTTDRLSEPSLNSRVTEQPKFDMDNFTDEIMTSFGRYRFIDIKYESYEYDGAVRIVSLKVNLRDYSERSFDYLQEQIIEAIGLRINKNNIVLETRIEFV